MTSKERAKDRFYRRAFDISLAEWLIILAYQKYRCPICGKPISKDSKPHTDHDHAQGNTRGILCGQCNRALGKAQDPRWKWSPECFLAAYHYLISPPAKNALGRQPIGFPGKIGTKRYRDWVADKEGKPRKKHKRKTRKHTACL